MIKLPQFRYYLEIISVPVFAFLVIHLAGEGFQIFFGQYDQDVQSEINKQFYIQYLGGISFLIISILLWNKTFLKKFVPCSHDHCHHVHIWSHFIAMSAFVFHFFPESSLRYQLLQNFDVHSFLSIAGVIGFASHFLVDIIVMVLLSGFWKKTWQKLLSFFIMVNFWIFAFYIGEQGGLELEGLSEPIILIFSGFLLAMFVHKPHKPKIEKCGSCHKH